MPKSVLSILAAINSSVNGPALAGLASLLTEHFAPGKLALQVRTKSNDVIVDDGFKSFFPGVDQLGGIEKVWQDLKENPAFDYAESPDWIFVKFIDGKPNIDGEHVIPRRKMAELMGRPDDKNRWTSGKLFYFDFFDLPNRKEYGLLSGASILWLLDASEDLRLKREQRRSEVAARAILEALFSAGAWRPSNFAFHSLPKNGDRRVGGDFFYLRRFPEDGKAAPDRICLFVGDCTGHGVGGALLAAMAGAILQRFFRASRLWQTDANPALRVIRYLDRELDTALTDAATQTGEESGEAQRAYAAPGAVDGCVIVIDFTRTPGATTIYAAGGNIPVWLMRQAEDLSQEQALQQIIGYNPNAMHKSIGPNLGIKSEKQYNTYDSILTEPARIFVATDGYYLQRDKPRESVEARLLGVDSLPVVLYQTRAQATHDAAQAILSHWVTFKGTTAQEDDMLLTVIDIPQPEKRNVGDVGQ